MTRRANLAGDDDLAFKNITEANISFNVDKETSQDIFKEIKSWFDQNPDWKDLNFRVLAHRDEAIPLIKSLTKTFDFLTTSATAIFKNFFATFNVTRTIYDGTEVTAEQRKEKIRRHQPQLHSLARARSQQPQSSKPNNLAPATSPIVDSNVDSIMSGCGITDIHLTATTTQNNASIVSIAEVGWVLEGGIKIAKKLRSFPRYR